MATASKFRVYLPYECLFDLRWGFIRKYSKLSEIELYSRFDAFCSRLSDDLTLIDPGLSRKFEINTSVVQLSPRTAILTTINNAYRQFASDTPDNPPILHITLDFSKVSFIPNDIRKSITDTLKESLFTTGNKAHVVNTSKGFGDYKFKELRKKFNAVIVHDILEFVDIYNAGGKDSIAGLGIITRPLFLQGKSPEGFHKFISQHDKRAVGVDGVIYDSRDHYDILSDSFSHMGRVYFHEPQYFSAIMPK